MAEVKSEFFSFRREFDKTHYPILGKNNQEEEDPVMNSTVYRSLRVTNHSVTVPAMIDLLRNEKGKWYYPVNGADSVFPGIFLGDETTALCIRYCGDICGCLISP